jgi:two-component system response regulator YesN
MYTLLLLDDEPAVVNGLAHDIDWEDTGVQRIIKAYSAQEALARLSETRIDLVISDIRMPGMDGLAFTEALRESSPHTKVIIMSGLDDFKMAQRAILLNVFSYMTKPAPYDEIRQMVRMAIRELEIELEQHQLLENAEQLAEESRAVLGERYLQNWIVRGLADPAKSPQSWRSAGLELLPEAPALLLLVRVDQCRSRPADDLYAMLQVQNLIRQTLFPNSPSLVLTDPDQHIVVLVQKRSREELAKTKRYMEGMADLLLSVAKRASGCTLSVFWDPELPGIEQMHEVYLKLKERARMTLPWESGIIQGLPPVRLPDQDERRKSLFGYPGFEQLIDRLDKTGALEHLHQLFDGEVKRGAFHYDMLLLIYYTVAGTLLKASFNRGVTLKEWAGSDAPHFYSLQTIQTIDHLKSWSVRVTERFIDYMSDKAMNVSNHLLKQAKNYVHERLGTNFSVQDIAAHLHVHPNYLSRLFTKETGVTITDYAIRLRMERAKKRLASPGVKIFEVAELVGYESVSHFNRIFKRETGMSPKEYQSSLTVDSGGG